jgi:hypothetical protein
MDQIHVNNDTVKKYFTCCRKDTKSFPFKVLPCTILGFMMDATSFFNCSLLSTYKGSSSLSAISHNFVLCRCGCTKKSVQMIHGYTYHTDQIVSVTKPHYKILNLSIQLECKHEKNTWGKLKAVLLSQITAKESLI